ARRARRDSDPQFTVMIIPAALAVWWMASRLNLLQLGDEEAHYLGVNVQALQRWLLLCSAVLVAAAVAISGCNPDNQRTRSNPSESPI
ncbi:iron chelate uptake ABC transporter family permease subunit, partial [Klebsiella pneumoniae]|uniref:iron chelate uptake ABC transporter family permease subunit n=1 Tax=Klebsiella pneumoniae TaxID=573 RepID=UPI0027316677